MASLSLLLLVILTVTHALPRCTKQEDCTRYDTYCEGPFICNRSRGHCVAAYPHYNPCKTLQEEANKFLLVPSDSDRTLSVICVNQVAACLEVYYCLSDKDCDDHLYCNGKERCVEGECKQASDLSQLCTECDESTKCGSTLLSAQQEGDDDPLAGAEPATDPTIIYVLAAGLAIVGLIAVALVLLAVHGWARASKV